MRKKIKKCFWVYIFTAGFGKNEYWSFVNLYMCPMVENGHITPQKLPKAINQGQTTPKFQTLDTIWGFGSLPFYGNF